MTSEWFPIIFPDRCDGCKELEVARCIKFCPHNVFMPLNNEIVVGRPQNCVLGCSACEPVCPKKAITFPQQEGSFTASKSKNKGLLRKVTCTECGKVFSTNRDVDVCFDCERRK